jgi:23S rRNA pseudouridine1911/1915/1917 synthase
MKRLHKPAVIDINQDYLVINKPAGMIVNRARTTKDKYTLQDWLVDYLKGQTIPWSMRSGLVHRLDKETSGLMVAALSKTAYVHLTGQFKKRRVGKQYFALVHGLLSP